METYPIPMIPGPVRVPEEILQAYQKDYGSADLEGEFLELYNHTEADLQQILATQNKVAIFTGEGMLALWAGLKSCLKPGDRVLCIATGVFGYGIGDMARSLGAEVRTVGFGFDETIYNWEEIERVMLEFRPKMITAVHCETPSGTLNPLDELGRLKRKHGVPLLYVDAVASLAGAPVLVDEWGIDLLLGGSQKALCVPPAMSFVAVSPAAWEIVRAVNYPGYDALLPLTPRRIISTSPSPLTGMAWLPCMPAPGGCCVRGCRPALPATNGPQPSAARPCRRAVTSSSRRPERCAHPRSRR